MDRHLDGDPRCFVVVPAKIGPIVALSDIERGRDEVDELLDDLLGSSDHRGPGPADIVLLVGGAGAIVLGVAGALPVAATVGGAAALGLGAILPLRAGWQRLSAYGNRRRIRAVVGDGTLLRVDDPAVERLLGSYRQVTAAAAGVAPTSRSQVEAVAFDAITEVASLLAGQRPATAAEHEYVMARAAALDALASAAATSLEAGGDSQRRQALVEARNEVDRIAGGSSITAASDLTRELLGGSEH